MRNPISNIFSMHRGTVEYRDENKLQSNCSCFIALLFDSPFVKTFTISCSHANFYLIAKGAFPPHGVFCMEFQEGMVCSHGTAFASKSWKFVSKGTIFLRHQSSKRKIPPIRCFVLPRGELPLRAYEFPLVSSPGSRYFSNPYAI